MLRAGAPPEPIGDLRVDLVGRCLWSFPTQTLAQHPFAHLVEVQGDAQPLGGRLRRRHRLSLPPEPPALAPRAGCDDVAAASPARR